MFKSLFLLVMMFLYAGCSVTSPHAKLEDKAPKWYYNTPKDDVFVVYGIGEGGTNQEATLNALAAINNKFGIKVSVDYKNEMVYDTATSYKENKKVSKYVETSSYVMELNNYEVVSSFERKGNLVVLVRLDKIKYTDFIKNKVEKEVKQLKMEEEQAKHVNFIMKTSIYQDLYVKSKEMDTYIKVYREILGHQNRLSRESRYLRVLEENYNKLVNNKNVNVEYKGKSIIFKDDFEIFLSENKFNIRTTPQKLKVVVQTDVNYDNDTGMTKYENKVTVIEQGDVIKNVLFNVIEYGKPEKNVMLARKHFVEEVNDLVLK